MFPSQNPPSQASEIPVPSESDSMAGVGRPVASISGGQDCQANTVFTSSPQDGSIVTPLVREAGDAKIKEVCGDGAGGSVQGSSGRLGEVSGVLPGDGAERAAEASPAPVRLEQRQISHTFHGLTNAQHGVHLVIADPREYECKDCKDLAARVKAKFKEIGYEF